MHLLQIKPALIALIAIMFVFPNLESVRRNDKKNGWNCNNIKLFLTNFCSDKKRAIIMKCQFSSEVL